MQSKELSILKTRLRKVFGDDHGIQWSDSLLDEILKEAYREYALYSGGLVGQYEIVPTGAAVYKLPDDFYKVVMVSDVDGREIPVVSYRRLLEEYGDFRGIKGDRLKSICLNFDNFGEFRIFPILPVGSCVGRIYYNRLPDKPEGVKNLSAIEAHCLFQMYQFTGKAQAQNSYNEFIDLISSDERNRLFNGRTNIRRSGVYY